jgi:hypothetical protein
MKRKTLLTIAVILAFAAFLAYTTLSAQKVTCTVCVEFNGRNNCSTASHTTELEAAQSAQSTACGPLTGGVNDAVACGRRPPVSQSCHAK